MILAQTQISLGICSVCTVLAIKDQESLKTPIKLSQYLGHFIQIQILKDFSLTVKAATLIFISGSAISSAKQGISGSIYYLVKN